MQRGEVSVAEHRSHRRRIDRHGSVNQQQRLTQLVRRRSALLSVVVAIDTAAGLAIGVAAGAVFGSPYLSQFPVDRRVATTAAGSAALLPLPLLRDGRDGGMRRTARGSAFRVVVVVFHRTAADGGSDGSDARDRRCLGRSADAARRRCRRRDRRVVVGIVRVVVTIVVTIITAIIASSFRTATTSGGGGGGGVVVVVRTGIGGGSVGGRLRDATALRS